MTGPQSEKSSNEDASKKTVSAPANRNRSRNSNSHSSMPPPKTSPTARSNLSPTAAAAANSPHNSDADLQSAASSTHSTVITASQSESKLSSIATAMATKKSTSLKFPRASNPNMDVHERVASEPIDVRISKALAAVLRHGKMGFSLDDEGFLAVDSILTHPYFMAQKCHFEDLKRISVNPVDGIKRFLLIKDDVSKTFKIRALQGHTVDIKDLDLIPLTLDDTSHTPFVIHGTFWKAWEKIKTNGLKLQNNRTHLHFQPGTLGKGCEPSDLVKRFRNNCEVLVYVDLARALDGGLKFHKSSNNVVLTKGDRYGRVPARFFLKAVHISPTTGEQIWIEALGNEDCVSGDTVIKGLERNSLTPKKMNKKASGPNPHPSRSRNTSHNFPTTGNRSRNTSENVRISPIH
jgi:2'-phosphotransferase